MAKEAVWKADLHFHVENDRSIPGDAAKNQPENTIPLIRRLIEKRKLNIVAPLCHDSFPSESERFSQALPKTPVMVGNEVSTHVPSPVRDSVRKLIFPMVHVLGYFAERPEDLPFKELTWPHTLREKIAFMSEATAPLPEVLNTIHDGGGIAIIAHPSPLPLPWSSLRLPEILGFLTPGMRKEVAIEVNGRRFFRPANRFVERFARKHNLAVVGGSDAHKPNQIGLHRTLFRRRTESPFEDLKTAIGERTTIVRKGA